MAQLRAEFQTADQAALVLNTFGGTPAVVGGLNSMTLVGETRDIQSFQVFGVDFETQQAGGGKRSAFAASGYLLVGDEDGQSVLEAAKIAKTKMKDVRAYIDTNLMHFQSLDLANDPGGFYQVTKAGADGAAGVSDAFKYALEMPCGGSVRTFAYHATGTDIAFAASGAKITSAMIDFIEAGFKTGRVLIIDGSTGNSGYAVISAVAQHELTIGTLTKVSGTNGIVATSGVAVTTEAAGPSISLHASTY
jgi:hypothetical protein